MKKKKRKKKEEKKDIIKEEEKEKKLNLKKVENLLIKKLKNMKNSFETETLNDNNAIKKKIKKTKSVRIIKNKKNVFKKGNANQNKSFAQRKSIFNNNLNSNIKSNIESQDINNLPNNSYFQKISSEIKRISLEKINNKGKA